MKEKTGEHAGARKEKINPFQDMAQQGVKNCEQAMRNGLKFQEEATKWWNNMAGHTGSAQDWQKRFSNATTVATNFTAAAQKRAEEFLDLAETNARAQVELTKKAADAMQAPTIAESQHKWIEFWTASLGVVRSSSESMAQISGRALDSWVDFVQKNGEMSQVRIPKAA